MTKVTYVPTEEISNPKLGLTIELDASQIVPDDPGQGTPAIVVKRDENGKELGSATFWCAADMGELEGEYYFALSPEERAWLNDQEDEVNAWVEEHSPK